jgi:hypothetical protein
LAEDRSDEAGRLEAALERIARAADTTNGRVHQEQDAGASPAKGDAAVDVRALSARLDALIEELRGILGQA